LCDTTGGVLDDLDDLAEVLRVRVLAVGAPAEALAVAVVGRVVELL
jgi:hypothetical protein